MSSFFANTSIVDTQIEIPSIAEILDVLSFGAGFNSSLVVLGATLLGVASGVIGVFALLRKRALMTDALAHSALPGLCIAFILGSLYGSSGKVLWQLLFGATISGIIGVGCVQYISKYTRVHEDSAIGIVLSSFFGLGIVLLSFIQSMGTGEEGGLSHFIFGQTATMNTVDAYYLVSVAVVSILVSTLCFKEFSLVCFDQQFARSDGSLVSVIDFLMMSIVVLVTVIGMQSVGLLLVVSFIVIPPAASRFWTENLKSMVVISAIVGGISGYLGSALSALLPRLPAGAIIVLVAGAIFFLSFFLAPKRGLLFLFIRQFFLRVRILEDHVLRELYERLESKGEEFLKEEEFVNFRDIPILSKSKYSRFIAYFFSFKGLLRLKQDKVCFTNKGLEKAKLKVRNHRLWEQYLVSYAHTPMSHVDYSADFAEHVLSPKIIKKLEQSLDALSVELPKSVHPILNDSDG